MGGNNGIPTCKFPAKGSAGEGSFYPNRIQNFLVIHSACGYVKFNHHKICLRFFPIIKNYTFWNISIKDIHNLFFGDLNGFLYFVNSLNSFDSIFFVVASFSSSFFLILFINTPPLFLFIYYFSSSSSSLIIVVVFSSDHSFYISGTSIGCVGKLLLLR